MSLVADKNYVLFCKSSFFNGYSLGIENVGVATAKVLCKEFSYDLERLSEASEEELGSVEGIGAVIAGTIRAWFLDENGQVTWRNCYEFIRDHLGYKISAKELSLCRFV